MNSASGIVSKMPNTALVIWAKIIFVFRSRGMQKCSSWMAHVEDPGKEPITLEEEHYDETCD